MTTETQPNPYTLEAGYEPRHDIAMTGYGITIESILHWLFDQGLPTEALGYQKSHPDDYEDAMSEDYQEFLRPMVPDNVLSYVQTSNADVEALMMFDIAPSNEVQTVPTQGEIRRQIVKAIMAIYAVPNEYKTKLVSFVDEYTDYVSISDYC